MEIQRREISGVGVKIYATDAIQDMPQTTLYVLRNQLHEEPFGLVVDWDLDQTHEQQGQESSLVEKVVKEAQQRDCYKLVVVSRDSDFERYGFSNHGKVFKLNYGIMGEIDETNTLEPRDDSQHEVKIPGVKFYVKDGVQELGRIFLFMLENGVGLEEDWFVDESLRGGDTGSRLLKSVIDEVINMDGTSLLATSRYSRPGIHRVYEKNGLSEYATSFRMDFR